MSDNKPLIVGDIDHDESNREEDSVPPHAEMTSIQGDVTSTALSRDDGVEITATSLTGASTQSAVRINVYENIPFAGGDGY